MSTLARYVGLDVHKDSIAMAVAEAGRDAPRDLGVIANDWPQLQRRLTRLGSPSQQLIAYEAGPTGDGLCRKLRAAGYRCEVIAPSKTPRRPGDRVKTDRRDARLLARALRAGDLTAVVVPEAGTEALRDLVRAREDAKHAERTARHQLDKFLLRHDRRFPGKTAWTGVHLLWISQQRFELPAQQHVLLEMLAGVQEATARVTRLTDAIAEHVPHSEVAPLVGALQALRGVRLVTAATIAAELGDLRRFARPRQLMSYVGLVPSESSSGGSVCRGAITKTGNGHVRRVLVEAAWSYRFEPRLGADLQKRSAQVAPSVRAIAWHAQHRLHTRWRRLLGRGKSPQRAITALARELSGFVWAIGQQSPLMLDSTP